MSIDQVRTHTFTPFFTAGSGPYEIALRSSDGNLYLVQRIIRVVGGSCPAIVAGKHCFLVYLENNEFCFVEAERLPSAEWCITNQSSALSLEKFSSQIAVCSHLRRDFENWWKKRLGFGWEDLGLIQQLSIAT